MLCGLLLLLCQGRLLCFQDCLLCALFQFHSLHGYYSLIVRICIEFRIVRAQVGLCGRGGDVVHGAVRVYYL